MDPSPDPALGFLSERLSQALARRDAAPQGSVARHEANQEVAEIRAVLADLDPTAPALPRDRQAAGVAGRPPQR
ncbi:MAG TPA: hypothetical protein VF763_04155 [Candidatus Limnocylindrales bacterium]